jgi:predicted amidohydrolase
MQSTGSAAKASIAVALLQLVPAPDQATAQVKGEGFCRRAKVMGADIALFPEMWNTGYRFRGEGP